MLVVFCVLFIVRGGWCLYVLLVVRCLSFVACCLLRVCCLLCVVCSVLCVVCWLPLCCVLLVV